MASYPNGHTQDRIPTTGWGSEEEEGIVAPISTPLVNIEEGAEQSNTSESDPTRGVLGWTPIVGGSTQIFDLEGAPFSVHPDGHADWHTAPSSHQQCQM